MFRAIIILVISLTVVGMRIADGFKSMSWKTTTATITGTHNTGTKKSSEKMDYKYTVDGKEYDKSDAEEPVGLDSDAGTGTKLEIAYDPNNPNDTLTHKPNLWIQIPIGIFELAMCAVLFLFKGSRPIRFAAYLLALGGIGISVYF
jgi:hypothetical protein